MNMERDDIFSIPDLKCFITMCRKPARVSCPVCTTPYCSEKCRVLHRDKGHCKDCKPVPPAVYWDQAVRMAHEVTRDRALTEEQRTARSEESGAGAAAPFSPGAQASQPACRGRGSSLLTSSERSPRDGPRQSGSPRESHLGTDSGAVSRSGGRSPGTGPSPSPHTPQMTRGGSEGAEEGRQRPLGRGHKLKTFLQNSGGNHVAAVGDVRTGRGDGVSPTDSPPPRPLSEPVPQTSGAQSPDPVVPPPRVHERSRTAQDAPTQNTEDIRGGRRSYPQTKYDGEGSSGSSPHDSRARGHRSGLSPTPRFEGGRKVLLPTPPGFPALSGPGRSPSLQESPTGFLESASRPPLDSTRGGRKVLLPTPPGFPVLSGPGGSPSIQESPAGFPESASRPPPESPRRPWTASPQSPLPNEMPPSREERPISSPVVPATQRTPAGASSPSAGHSGDRNVESSSVEFTEIPEFIRNMTSVVDMFQIGDVLGLEITYEDKKMATVWANLHPLKDERKKELLAKCMKLSCQVDDDLMKGSVDIKKLKEGDRVLVKDSKGFERAVVLIPSHEDEDDIYLFSMDSGRIVNGGDVNGVVFRAMDSRIMPSLAVVVQPLEAVENLRICSKTKREKKLTFIVSEKDKHGLKMSNEFGDVIFARPWDLAGVPVTVPEKQRPVYWPEFGPENNSMLGRLIDFEPGSGIGPSCAFFCRQNELQEQEGLSAELWKIYPTYPFVASGWKGGDLAMYEKDGKVWRVEVTRTLRADSDHPDEEAHFKYLDGTSRYRGPLAKLKRLPWRFTWIPPLVLWVHLLNDKLLNVPDAAKSFIQHLIERKEPVQIKLSSKGLSSGIGDIFSLSETRLSFNKLVVSGKEQGRMENSSFLEIAETRDTNEAVSDDEVDGLSEISDEGPVPMWPDAFKSTDFEPKSYVAVCLRDFLDFRERWCDFSGVLERDATDFQSRERTDLDSRVDVFGQTARALEERPVNGQIVLVKQKDRFFRAMFMESRKGNVNVCFLDDGLFDKVDVADMRKFPGELLKEPLFCSYFKLDENKRDLRATCRLRFDIARTLQVDERKVFDFRVTGKDPVGVYEVDFIKTRNLPPVR